MSRTRHLDTDPRAARFEHPALAVQAVRRGDATASEREVVRGLLAAHDARSATATQTPATPPAQPAPAGQAGAGAPSPAPAPAAPPAVLPALAGAAAQPAATGGTASWAVLSEPSTYTFDGRGESVVRDAWRARMEGDGQASARLNRFRGELQAQAQATQAGALRNLGGSGTAAVATRAGWPEVIPPGYRPEFAIEPIDKGRPLVSRLPRIAISDATPFRIPVLNTFDGVGDHTEGEAHRPEGTLGDFEEITVSPKAISGAFRISREMIDSSNPALDSIAVSEMQRDYRDLTEARAVAALQAAAPLAGAVTATNVAGLTLAIISHDDARQLPPDLVMLGSSFYNTVVTEEAADGRPVLPYLGPTNASGTTAAGFTGAGIQGVPLVKAWALGSTEAYTLTLEDVKVFESPLLSFRFDEVEGPGVVKFALWSYFHAQALRPAGVRRLKSA